MIDKDSISELVAWLRRDDSDLDALAAAHMIVYLVELLHETQAALDVALEDHEWAGTQKQLKEGNDNGGQTTGQKTGHERGQDGSHGTFRPVHDVAGGGSGVRVPVQRVEDRGAGGAGYAQPGEQHRDSPAVSEWRGIPPFSGGPYRPGKISGY